MVLMLILGVLSFPISIWLVRARGMSMMNRNMQVAINAVSAVKWEDVQRDVDAATAGTWTPDQETARRGAALQAWTATGTLITMAFGLLAASCLVLLLTHWIFGWPPG